MMFGFLLACAAGPGSVDPADTDLAGTDLAGRHTLTVEDGYGGGDYAAGAVVPVFAAVHPQIEVVTGWEGAPLAEWNGTVTMPDHDLTVRPALAATPVVWQDVDAALVASPADPRGTVLFFHGARYDRTELRDNAGMTLAAHLVAARWTVVGLDSAAAEAAGAGGWVDADLPRVEAWLAAHPSPGPVVVMGMSSGGQFAHRAGAALPAAAVVAFCAPGDAATLAATTTPTAWMLAERDRTFPSGVEEATGWEAGLVSRGIRTLLYVHATTPLYPARFERIAGVDAAASRGLAEAIEASGAWTAAGWTAFGSDVSIDVSAFDDATQEAIAAEVEIMAADHELYDDGAAAVVAFLDGV